MTKFDSEAIGVRAGRQKGGLPTQKERKKEMEQFLKTGVHATHEAAKATPAIPTLPERDPHRPHVFMDFRIGPQALGATCEPVQRTRYCSLAQLLCFMTEITGLLGMQSAY